MNYLQFLEVLWIPAALMFGWQQYMIHKLADKIDKKADTSDVSELKEDIKKVIELLTESRIEMSRWQGRTEQKHL